MLQALPGRGFENMFTGNEEDNRSDKGDGHRQQKHRGGMFPKWEEYIGWGHVGRLWNKMTFGLTERKVFGEYVFFHMMHLGGYPTESTRGFLL
jgi:hypothetical protein